MVRAMAAAALITAACSFAVPSTAAYAAVTTASAAHPAATHARATSPARRVHHHHHAKLVRRLGAFYWARHQAGKPYEWGGTGPSGYDCSGLVWAAYRHEGIKLPRTTYQMLASSILVWIPASKVRPGDLAFYGSGHVEMVDRRPRSTFGALEPGTVVWWHQVNQWWHPTAYYRVRHAG
jgi:cell wall-associated NlpC family hydrolase